MKKEIRRYLLCEDIDMMMSREQLEGLESKLGLDLGQAKRHPMYGKNSQRLFRVKGVEWRVNLVDVSKTSAVDFNEELLYKCLGLVEKGPDKGMPIQVYWEAQRQAEKQGSKSSLEKDSCRVLEGFIWNRSEYSDIWYQAFIGNYLPFFETYKDVQEFTPKSEKIKECCGDKENCTSTCSERKELSREFFQGAIDSIVEDLMGEGSNTKSLRLETLKGSDYTGGAYPQVMEEMESIPKDNLEERRGGDNMRNASQWFKSFSQRPAFKEISKDSSEVLKDQHRTFDTGSRRDSDLNKPLVKDMDPYVRLRYGYHMMHNAKKYSKGNWELGQPTESLLESLHRHLAYYEQDLKTGDKPEEDHLSAILFAVKMIMLNEERDEVKDNSFYVH